MRPKGIRTRRRNFENLEHRIVMAGDFVGAMADVACELRASGESSEIDLFAETETSLIWAETSDGSLDIWRADLDGTGAAMVATANGQPIGDQQTVHNDRWYFTTLVGEGIFGTDPVELWATDGTADGTAMLAEIGTWDLFGQAVTVDFHSNGDNLLLKITQSFVESSESSLWSTTGTAESTVRYADGFRGPINGIQNVAEAGGMWVFDGQTSNGGLDSFGLYSTDVAEQSTGLIREFEVPVNGLTAAGANAFFASSDTDDIELWMTDGTTDGTAALANINAADSSEPRDLVSVGDTLFFTADNGINGRELWTSNGTREGTVLVEDLNPEGSADIRDMIAVGDRLFFTLHDGDVVELWSSDGTADGTSIVATLPGRIETFTNSFSSPVASGGSLFFVVDDEASGSEVWVSDGTADGTAVAIDARPGSEDSDPYLLTAGIDRVLFVAERDAEGNSILAIDTEGDVGNQVGELPGDANGDGVVDFSDFLVLSRHFNQEVEPNTSGDLDGSGIVDFSDFLIYSGNFGRELGD